MKKLIVLIALLSSIGNANAYCDPVNGIYDTCDAEDRDYESLGSLKEQLELFSGVNSMIDPMSRGTKVTIDGKEYRCIQHSDDSIECEKYQF